jgi:hypothetical protein
LIFNTYGLFSGLVRRIQITVIQLIALYRAEIWWQGQETWAENIQRLINKQVRSITGVLKSTFIRSLVKETALTSAVSLLENKQRRYALKALKPQLGQTPLRGAGDQYLSLVTLRKLRSVRNEGW